MGWDGIRRVYPVNVLEFVNPNDPRIFFMADTKCANPLCNCIAPAGQKFCSTYCEDAKDLTVLECECAHPACGSTL